MTVYLDNAATTPMDKGVIKKMSDAMSDIYGNPSAIHAIGRKAKAELEIARRSISKLLNCSPTEIIFTGSGTEADNMALRCAVNDLNVKHIITSIIEHKAVLDTAKDLESKGMATIHFVDLDPEGKADLNHLNQLAAKYPGALISLMHANNEIGTLNDLKEISTIARKNNCLFHSDTVQSMGHYSFDLAELDVDFLTCSAHKIHGPKGIGFLYKKKSLALRPIITGGGQESKMRAGTENTLGIIGLATAFSKAYESLDEDMKQILEIKHYAIQQLREKIQDVKFNGNISPEGGLYTVLNVSIPSFEGDSTLLYELDIKGVCVSGGSACNSGALGSSHVLDGIGHAEKRTAVRLSFSKYNTKEDIDFAVQQLESIVNKTQQV